jgi:hypothetical protein
MAEAWRGRRRAGGGRPARLSSPRDLWYHGTSARQGFRHGLAPDGDGGGERRLIGGPGVVRRWRSVERVGSCAGRDIWITPQQRVEDGMVPANDLTERGIWWRRGTASGGSGEWAATPSDPQAAPECGTSSGPAHEERQSVRSAVTGGATEIGEARGGEGLPERNGVGKALDKWHECPSYRLVTQGGKKQSKRCWCMGARRHRGDGQWRARTAGDTERE